MFVRSIGLVVACQSKNSDPLTDHFRIRIDVRGHFIGQEQEVLGKVCGRNHVGDRHRHLRYRLPSFPLTVELVAVSLVTMLGLILAMAQYKPEHAGPCEPHRLRDRPDRAFLRLLQSMAHAGARATNRYADDGARILRAHHPLADLPVVPIAMVNLRRLFGSVWKRSQLGTRRKSDPPMRVGANICKLDRWRQSLLVLRSMSADGGFSTGPQTSYMIGAASYIEGKAFP
jgi:hypothetical protein